jgi:Fe/S biogenesis protein NfuA
MLTISPEARKKIAERIEQVDRSDLILRIEIAGRSADDFQYRLSFVPDKMRDPADHSVELDGLELLVEPISARYLEGAQLNYITEGEVEGFKMDNPNPLWHDDAGAVVQQLIESQINPAIAMHGGQVTLLDVQDNVAYVSMGGGCQGCGLASVTLRQGVETMIQEQIPAIREIVDITDHTQGLNPYFQPEAAGQSPLG